MDSPFMTEIATGIAQHDWRVVRFEFPYMHRRRITGKKGGPGHATKLVGYYQSVIDHFGDVNRLVIGGKSMGGRIASMIADQSGVAGLMCFGFPFHPRGKPDRVRTAHLSNLKTPTLIVQGTRDPLGLPEEIETYTLADTIEIVWAPDGDHSFKPRKSSGRTSHDNLTFTIQEANRFIDQLDI